MAKENGNNDPLVPKTKREEETPPAGEAATLPPASAFEGAVTAHLRSKTGIRGEISLPSEDLREETPAGPASKGRYGVLGEIARGGMGAIVKLVDNDIRRPVAMKVILGEGVKERVERFVEEAQVTGQLEHPNIVPVHELGLDPDGKVYFTMKLVKGESLDAIIDALADKDPEVVRNYPLSHLLQIFLKVCDAIAFAHSKGVIHRDLKPENVMVGRFGEVLVMDWGLAKVRGREDTAVEELVETVRSEREVGKTLSGEVMGTPSYMPPEQASGKVERIDERSDVFALGAMLYKILTHEAPYTGSHVTEVLTKAVTCAYKAPRVKSPWNRIPKELQSIGAEEGPVRFGGGDGGGHPCVPGSPSGVGAPFGSSDAFSPLRAAPSGRESGRGGGVDSVVAGGSLGRGVVAACGGGAGEGAGEGGAGGGGECACGGGRPTRRTRSRRGGWCRRCFVPPMWSWGRC
ncbi:MAG: serine/threonine-protein kinase [Planctomycetota bacterium]|jgi:tRNA A-37 threonylcarbamoyl transferase component Bud32